MPSVTDSPGQPKRLKLTMPTPDGQTPLRGTQFTSSPATRASAEEDRSSTPPRPSYSPVTPVLSHPSIMGPSGQASSNPRPVQWIDEPPPVPIALEENADAIAVQAALSILQLQKQQALRDIRNLSKTKAAAIQEPEAFLGDLKSGKLTLPPKPAVITITGDEESEGESSDTKHDDDAATTTKFGKFPEMQDVVRCPPVNWAKYHVVGESLDKLHEEQRKRPESGLPRTDEPPPEHVIAAPYRPFTDKVELPPPMQTRSGSKSEK